MPKPTFSRFLHKRQEQHSELSNGLVKTCRMERATGEIFVEMSENKGQKTSSDKKHYLTENIIRQKHYLSENIVTLKISSDKKHYLTQKVI